jgi:hypothetical protein
MNKLLLSAMLSFPLSLGLLLIISCEIENGKSDQEKFFGGHHELLNTSHFVDNNFDGYVYSDSAYVQFSWKDNKNEWIQAKFSKELVRYDFSPDSVKPYCKFKWRWRRVGFEEKKWANEVIYVVLCVSQKDIILKKYPEKVIITGTSTTVAEVKHSGW